MKNFDIEKLERKNIYKTPENFFGEVQENVLNEISSNRKTERKSAKILYLSRNYAVAASLVLLFGAAAFWQISNQNFINTNTSDSLKTAVIITENLPEKQKPQAYQTLKNDIEEAKTETTENTVKYAESKPQKTLEKEIETVTPKTKKEIIPSTTEAQFEQIMKELPNTEIADIGKGAEQDVYLDLYY